MHKAATEAVSVERRSPPVQVQRLADFIEGHTDEILAEWVTFAESCGPAGITMDLVALRDHALAMLAAIVTDLRTPQTAAEQTAKSHGDAVAPTEAPDTAAEVHGAGRARSGFTFGEMVSEYRALRASVIRLWVKACGDLTGADVDDLMRFNEAIDQALAESVTRYAGDIDRSREMFVAILGHDLRTPLNAVIMGAQFMLDTGELPEPHLTLTARIAQSGRRMNRMVGELLDFTRGRLGTGIPVTRAETDLGNVARVAIDELRLAEPGAVLEFTGTGNLCGSWDAERISQLLTNLMANAIQHGMPGATVTVTAQGETDEVVLRIHNSGPPIARDELAHLFSPFKRVRADRKEVQNALSSLGLGLYIVDRIVAAHGGTIEVRSSAERGTLFTVRLPR